MRLLLIAVASLSFGTAQAATVVPNEAQMPGTQPNEVGSFESPDRCDNCHAGYALNPEDEPATGWRGAPMGNAGRDPIFWATLAVAEQHFDGAGDLCIRCHSTGGWYAGRSTPTDGSGLFASDDDGVDCDTCHTMTNPDNSEHLGVMNAPFTANCSDDDVANNSCENAAEGYYGSGMLSVWPSSDKLGPYLDADARHQFMQSKFHRSVDFCGTCHDVSNPVVGDLAPGNGAQPDNPHQVIASGVPGAPVEDKAAFNNPPFSYGVVERTFSEYKASAFPTTRVADFGSLPEDLKLPGGSLDVTYQAALLAGKGGDYEDGTARYFSCQSCHMRPTVGYGANKKGIPHRTDLPRHDHTGGNYWLADLTEYQDVHGLLRLGGGLTGAQLLAMDLGKQRAVDHLTQAASLSVAGNRLKVVNLTGHKLISGYPEGRRMWLNVKWYDDQGELIREDGAYGPLVDASGNPVMVDNPAGGQVQVESILDLYDPNTKIYEAHYAMTQEWAAKLLSLGYASELPLSFDRYTGAVNYTLGELAAQAPGSDHETFHFVLNNHVTMDNRIPPYGMRFTEAQQRNALPVPHSQYGAGEASYNGLSGVYQYWDEVTLDPPAGAVSADIGLLYQGTSWEYIQFLALANSGANAFLGAEGRNMLQAWINAEVPMAMEVAGDRTMVPPVVMASTTWGAPVSNQPPLAVGDSYSTAQDSPLNVAAPGVLGNDSDPDADALTSLLVTDASNGSLALGTDGAFSYTPNTGFNGIDSFSYQAKDTGDTLSNIVDVQISVTATGGGTEAGVTSVLTGVYAGKGKTQTFNVTDTFVQGDTVVIRAIVQDSDGNPLAGATVGIAISGPESVTLTSGLSDANGLAEANWKTSTPNRRGDGGTLTGSYTATVRDVSAEAVVWDGAPASQDFIIQ